MRPFSKKNRIDFHLENRRPGRIFGKKTRQILSLDKIRNLLANSLVVAVDISLRDLIKRSFIIIFFPKTHILEGTRNLGIEDSVGSEISCPSTKNLVGMGPHDPPKNEKRKKQKGKKAKLFQGPTALFSFLGG